MLRLKDTKLAVVLIGIGIVAGAAVSFAIVNAQTRGQVFTRVVEDEGNPWLDPEFLKSYQSKISTGANYKSKLAVGQEGFFYSDAKGGNKPYTFEWRFSDGVILTAQNATRSFDSPGRYTFDLIVTDADGKQGKSTAMFLDVLESMPEDVAEPAQTSGQ